MHVWIERASVQVADTHTHTHSQTPRTWRVYTQGSRFFSFYFSPVPFSPVSPPSTAPRRFKFTRLTRMEGGWLRGWENHTLNSRVIFTRHDLILINSARHRLLFRIF